ncbi:MAG: inositol monophosphatase [Melioribacteraceae bacterium]|nr:inositol monophosphatase [Melioribacteraceae bacterium]MCF8355655.1 inositol monophosphatase [Melioribacteraceae bacterium]MCF8395143.1 inositol monophosphatase [Melioribacteraceae bacterium]MCF8420563.1 inositol monophosphatase [Melioribacteraceae bacterium]
MIEKIAFISRIAGNIIREGFGKNFSIEYKTNSSNLVTEIDKKAESTIIEYVKKEFPGHGIIAEESGNTETESEYLWVIDPLDGTTNFAHGLPIFSVSIGVQKNGETIAGAVYDVMRDVMYSAELGSGSFANNRRIYVNENEDLSKSVLVTGFPYHIKDNPNRAIEKFGAFLKSSRAVRRLGSAAIDLCYVAGGVFDGYWEVYLNPWDMCAGNLILEEAGGKITDFSGEPMNIYSKQLLATNGKVHSEMLEIISRY